MISLQDLRSDLLPELENKFGRVLSRVELSGKRLFLKFSTEENAICGQASVSEYIAENKLPLRVINSTETNAIIIIAGREGDLS